MKKKPSVFYKTLADLMGEGKFDALDALQIGHQKMREIQDAHPLLVRYMQAIQPLVKAIEPIQELMMPVLETQRAIVDYLDIHKRLAQNIHALPANGWYFSMEFIDILGIPYLDSLLETDPEGFEAQVANTFTEQMSAIEKKLSQAFPKRAALLKNIFALHSSENYEAAIPLALTQADGMCKDVFFVLDKRGNEIPVGFFDMDHTHSSTRAQRLSQSFNVHEIHETSIFNVLLNQLAKVDRNTSLVLEGNTKRLSDLNRHAILHGESTDYGTRVNSIKAILLLDFIEDLRIMN